MADHGQCDWWSRAVRQAGAHKLQSACRILSAAEPVRGWLPIPAAQDATTCANSSLLYHTGTQASRMWAWDLATWR